MNETETPVTVGLHCYDNVVDISDESITVNSAKAMDSLRKKVLPFLSSSSNGGDDPQSTTPGSNDVFYINVTNEKDPTLLNSKPVKHSFLELKSPSKCNQIHKQPSIATKYSDDKDLSQTTGLLEKELLETEGLDEDIVTYTCTHVHTLNSLNEIRDAKSVSPVSDGSVLIADFLGNKVANFEDNGQAKYFTESVIEPWAAVMTVDGHVAVTSRGQGCLVIWSKDGKSLQMLGKDILKSPCGLAVDETGRFIVTDEGQNDVFVFERSGLCLFRLTVINEMSFKQPRYVCCSSSGHIIVSDSGNHCVNVFNQDGQFLYKFGSFGKENGQFKFPYGICVDDKDNIIVADLYNSRVVMFSETGKFVQNLLTSNMGLKCPYGVCFDCTNGRLLYVTHGELRASKVEVFKLGSMKSDLTYRF